MKSLIVILSVITLCNTAAIPVEVITAPEKQPENKNVFESTKNNFFEGDIVLPNARAGLIDTGSLWTSFPIPYTFEGSYDHVARRLVAESLDEISIRTCISFVEKTSETQTPYIYYKKDKSCFSGVGTPDGDRAVIALTDDCMHDRVVILHETLHTLGFYHEQSRPDRDDYVTIQWDYISGGNAGNFDLNSALTTTTDGIEYDYVSIMHYGAYAFTTNTSVPTIVPHDSSITTIGRQSDFTPLDIKRINTRYSCDAMKYDNGYTEWTDWSKCDIECKQSRRRYCDDENICSFTTYEESFQIETQDCSDCVKAVNPDCGPTYINSCDGVIASPFYPYYYGNAMHCVTTIEVPKGLQVQINFQRMDVEDYQGGCYYDFLHFYDGPDANSPKLATVCSTKNPDYITSTSNFVTVVFDSDGSVNGKGFSATFHSTENPLFECWFEEEDLAGCNMVQDDITPLSWTLHSGLTPTTGTGPIGDHTNEELKEDNTMGQYVYFETSDTKLGDSSRLLTKRIEGSQFGVCLSFWYSMYGTAMGKLEVQTIDDDGIVDVKLLLSGSTAENIWYQQLLTIDQHGGYKVGFNAIMGTYYLSDIAIDDILITRGHC